MFLHIYIYIYPSNSLPDPVKVQELFSVSQSSQLFTLVTVCSLSDTLEFYIQNLQNESFHFKFKNTHKNKTQAVHFMVIMMGSGA